MEDKSRNMNKNADSEIINLDNMRLESLKCDCIDDVEINDVSGSMREISGDSLEEIFKKIHDGTLCFPVKYYGPRGA